MRALRVIPFFALASCGGFLPFSGDDEDETPPAPLADASDAADANDGRLSAVEGGITPADSSAVCKPAAEACAVATECCTGSDCRAQKCCILEGRTPNASLCCTGVTVNCGQLEQCCLPDA